MPTRPSEAGQVTDNPVFVDDSRFVLLELCLGALRERHKLPTSVLVLRPLRVPISPGRRGRGIAAVARSAPIKRGRSKSRATQV